ncbi:MAG: hypothetical protein AAB710_01915 [Patescibacteria group bacterium]
MAPEPLKKIKIMADILPPQSKEARPAARPLLKAPSLPPKRASQPLRAALKENILLNTEKRPPGNKQALDEWFQKERKARTSAGFPPTPVFARKPRAKRFLIVFGALVFLLFLGGIGASYVFGRMKVHAVLKSASVEINEELRVKLTPADAEMDLAGELLQLSDTRQEEFAASGKDNVKAKAKGTVTIYNAFDAKPQLLVANTRFESPDGKIYRIRESVSVPGAENVNGVLTPRSVEAVIYADQPGPAYNKGLTDFKIPGFKGTPRYEGFYARSKTPLEGGFIGESLVVIQQDLDKARESLEQGLREVLIQKLQASVPEGFRLLDVAYEITTDKREFSAEAGDAVNTFTGALTLNARGLLFRNTDYDRFLVLKAGLQPEAVTRKNNTDLAVDVVLRNIDQGTLLLRTHGTAQFVWNLDQSTLLQRLADTRNTNMINDVFREFDAINRAEVRFSPSWMQIIPRDTAHIDLEISY